MKTMPKIDRRTVREKLCDLLFRSPNMPSKDRRAQLLQMMQLWEIEYPTGVVVNRHHCANTHKDRDLQWLIKRNKIAVHRQHSKFHSRFAETFLRVVK